MDLNVRILGVSVIVCILGVSGLSFVAGRRTSPSRVEEKVVVKTEWKDKVQIEWKDRVEEKIVYVQAKAKNTQTVSREIIKPDGTVERERIETQVEQTQTTSGKDVVAEQTGTAVAETRGNSMTISEIKPQRSPEWKVSLLAGASVNPVLLPSPWVAGVHVQRRVLGPVHVGAWALTSLSAGVSVGIEF